MTSLLVIWYLSLLNLKSDLATAKLLILICSVLFVTSPITAAINQRQHYYLLLYFKLGRTLCDRKQCKEARITLDSFA
jgi:hypothetical protein